MSGTFDSALFMAGQIQVAAECATGDFVQLLIRQFLNRWVGRRRQIVGRVGKVLELVLLTGLIVLLRHDIYSFCSTAYYPDLRVYWPCYSRKYRHRAYQQL